MKLSKFLAGVALFLLGAALLTTFSFLLVFRQVQESFTKTIPEPDNPGESCVIADHPALISDVPIIVPTIISSNSLKQSKGSSTSLYSGGEITQPADNIMPSNNFTLSATINIPTSGDSVG